jgi:hypothetical protein
VGNLLWIVSAPCHRLRDLGKTARGFGGHILHRSARAEFIRRREKPAQLFQVIRFADVFEADRMNFGRTAGEMGVDLIQETVADNQQRRIVEGQGIHHELLKGFVQVTAGRFVFPPKMVTHPDISPTMCSPCFRCPALETVVVRVTGFFDAEQLTEVEKIGLSTCLFGKCAVLPLGNKFGGCHLALLWICTR